MIEIPRDQLVEKLAVIGREVLWCCNSVPFIAVVRYVKKCVEQFGLIDEEEKTLTFLLTQRRQNDLPPNGESTPST